MAKAITKAPAPPWFVKTTTDGKYVAVNTRDTYALEAVATPEEAKRQCAAENAKWRKLQRMKVAKSVAKARGKK